ncbi:hypothetical protein B7495_09770 [Cryobacterium sp. LW097]|uniref:hypothetical protein n=1 Tax=unclassified Cryobacterium TaxID=2649013 RepID=UPI000B4D51A9|nr:MULTISPECIES: hypothetical protein [unclassified Cryobacterium]ASD22339.1 hypothetical protein B7495_09770 [Cryobacterium sp. LW097]TFC55504.1 hypothetical protein E3O68_05610 [Cryobacterium sp. TMB3-1-2]TFC72940.1 hypothetical protein E3T21_05925 [Cryobacterium sp. TMB3-15]TFC76446.1 hypothetical protein E3T22_11065 [Cryobacterium sp. TMB3-10]TFD43661.1 hypothetical protein E3T58_07680 [Cryobacterium sp. TMB3-12]
MPDEDPAPAGPNPEVPPAVRAQLLATEHWSLLASRSTTQGEVLTRISMFLYLVSAGLVSLALAGQATQFDEGFPGFALTVLGIILLVGILTQVRVTNVSMEDLAYVLAMNRLRAAYVELDPGVAPYLMASRFDDLPGTQTTYYFLGGKPRNFSQVLGSSMMFIIAVNSTLLGLLLAGITLGLGLPLLVCLAISVVGGVGFLAGSIVVGGTRYLGFWRRYTPLFPSPPAE